MRPSPKTLLLAALSFAGVAAAHASDRATTAQQQVQSALDGMERAANAHDTDRYMAFFAHRPELVFAINGEVIHGWDALRAKQLEWWQHGKSDAVYTETAKAGLMPLADDLIVTTSPLAARRTLADGTTSASHFVVTSIWKQLPQGWRVVYAHESWAASH